jgi:predicted DNA-binding ribbon-helix-helix protein
MRRRADRRTVSVSPRFYAKLEAYAESRGESVSSIVERVLAKYLDTTPPRAQAFRPRRGKS